MEKMKSVFENALVLIVDRKITSLSHIRKGQSGRWTSCE
jgi:hypothetical protein